MRKKGIALSINTMISIVLIIIVLAVGLTFQEKIFQGIKAFLEGFGVYKQAQIDPRAVDSFNALYCGINIISSKDPNDCKNNKVFFTGMVVYDVITSNVIKNGNMKIVAKYGETKVLCDNNLNFCIIENFALPQEINDKEYAKQYISTFSDPRYIIYYEEFPKGEEKGWTILMSGNNKLLGVGISAGLGAALSLVKFPGIAKKISKNIENKIGNKMVVIAEKIAQKNIKKTVIHNVILLPKEELKQYISKNKNEKIAYLFKDMVKIKYDLWDDNVDDLLIKYIKGEIKDIEGYDKVISKEIKDDLELLKKGYEKYAKKKGVGDEEVVILKDISSTLLFKSVNKERMREILKDVVRNIPEDKEAQIYKAINKRLVKLIATDPYLMMFAVNSIGYALEEDIIDNQIKEGIKCSILASTLSSRALKKGVALPSATCSALFYIGIISVKADLSNEIYTKSGFNTFYLYSPEFVLNTINNEFGKRRFSLYGNDNLKPYLIALEKNNGNLERFYLASPCYADLKIKKEKRYVKAAKCPAYETIKEIVDNNNNVLLTIPGFGHAISPSYEITIKKSRPIKKKIGTIIKDLCSYGENYEYYENGERVSIKEFFLSPSDLEIAKYMCGCLPDNIVGNNNRYYPLDRDVCQRFLLEPALPVILRVEDFKGNAITMLSPYRIYEINETLYHIYDGKQSSKINYLIKAYTDTEAGLKHFIPCSIADENEKEFNPVMGLYVEYAGIKVPLKIKEFSYNNLFDYMIGRSILDIQDGEHRIVKDLNLYQYYKALYPDIEETEIPIDMIVITPYQNKNYKGKDNFCYTGEPTSLENVLPTLAGGVIDVTGYVLGIFLVPSTGGVSTGLIAITSAISSGVSYWIEASIEEKYKWPNNEGLVVSESEG